MRFSLDLKRYDEAFAACGKALALKPDLAEVSLGRGNVFADAKRYDDAFAAYDKVLAFKSDRAEAWLGRGNISLNGSVTTKPLRLMTRRWRSIPIWLKHGSVAVIFSRTQAPR